jgi:hypothetical protein
VTAKRASLIDSTRLAALDAEVKTISEETARREGRAQHLEDQFHEETDGTGGSRRYGYSDVARVKESAAVEARGEVADLRETLRQRQKERDVLNSQIDRQIADYRESLSDDFLTKMKALSDLSAQSNAVWWISAFVVFLLAGIEVTPVLVKVMSPIGPYDIKLDAMNSVETKEALMRRDTTTRILAHHYQHVETVEQHMDNMLKEVRMELANDALHRKANQWASRVAATSIQEFVEDVKAEILTQRTG